MIVKLIFDDWRQDGQSDSIYQTELGAELSSGDLHRGTVIDAYIVFDDWRIDQAIRDAWQHHRAYPVFRLMPEASK